MGSSAPLTPGHDPAHFVQHRIPWRSCGLGCKWCCRSQSAPRRGLTSGLLGARSSDCPSEPVIMLRLLGQGGRRWQVGPPRSRSLQNRALPPPLRPGSKGAWMAPARTCQSPQPVAALRRNGGMNDAVGTPWHPAPFQDLTRCPAALRGTGGFVVRPAIRRHDPDKEDVRGSEIRQARV